MNARYPTRPRQGLPGIWDRLNGPGLTMADNLGIAGSMIAGGALGPLAAALRGQRWTTAIVTAPPAQRRPLATVLCTGGMLLDTYAWRPTPGLEWVAPVLYLKTLVAHAASTPPSLPIGPAT